MHCNRFTLLLVFSSCFVLSLQQATTVESSQRISGIKYVAPLNSIPGYNQSDNDPKYECYRCNRYKGGGAACPETQRQIPGNNVPDDAPPAEMIVRGCEVCLKVFTTMFFRNKDYIADKFTVQRGKDFESLNVISRTCIEDKKDARLLSGCITDTSAGGSIERCYCQGHLCNSSTLNTSISLPLIMALTFALFGSKYI